MSAASGTMDWQTALSTLKSDRERLVAEIAERQTQLDALNVALRELAVTVSGPVPGGRLRVVKLRGASSAAVARVKAHFLAHPTEVLQGRDLALEGVPATTVSNALSDLVTAGVLERPRRGEYRLAPNHVPHGEVK